MYQYSEVIVYMILFYYYNYYFGFRIGVAEKGFIMVELSVHTSAGHSSMPPKETSIGIMSNAVAK